MKDIPGYEGRYAVTKEGRVWQHGRFLDASKFRYPRVTIDGKRLYVHRLVALTYLTLKEGRDCVNHKNGIKSDNCVENLEWVSNAENVQHAFRIGLAKGAPPSPGSKNPSARLSEAQVLEIRRRSRLGEKRVTLCKEFGISYGHLKTINRRKTWRHI